MACLFRWIRRIEECLLAAGILVIAAMTIANVIARNLGGHSLAFAEEICQFMIIQVCFVGLSYAAGMGRHIRMTALYDLLPHKPRKCLMILIAGLTSALMFLLAWYSIQYVLAVHDSGSVSPTLRVPMAWVYAVAPVGLILAGIQYALAVIQNLRSPKVYLSWERTDEYDEAPSDAI